MKKDQKHVQRLRVVGIPLPSDPGWQKIRNAKKVALSRHVEEGERQRTSYCRSRSHLHYHEDKWASS